MDAIVTVRFKFPNVCTPEDLIEDGVTFEEEVKRLIKEEGLMNVVKDINGEILEVKEAQ